MEPLDESLMGSQKSKTPEEENLWEINEGISDHFFFTILEGTPADIPEINLKESLIFQDVHLFDAKTTLHYRSVRWARFFDSGVFCTTACVLDG